MGATAYNINGSSYDSDTSRWSVGGTIKGTTGLDASKFNTGDIIFDNNTSYGIRRWKIVEIDGSSGIDVLNVYVVYDGPNSITNPVSEKPATSGGYGAVCNISHGYICDNPSIVVGQITEELHSEILNINNSYSIGPYLGKNTTLCGQSGFASHESDASSSINTYIEWDDIDKTHYHRSEPQDADQNLYIKIGFQFPSYFTGLRSSGNALEFYAKANNGSTLGTNYCQLVSLINADGTEYAVTGKSITSSSRSLIGLTLTEINSILSGVVWNKDYANLIVYAKFQLFGNINDKIYLDADNAFLYQA